jgi:hypothetical protein
MRSTNRLFLAGLGALLLLLVRPGSAQQAASDWPMYRHDIRGSG